LLHHCDDLRLRLVEGLEYVTLGVITKKLRVNILEVSPECLDIVRVK
jgi:hypothetical protein